MRALLYLAIFVPMVLAANVAVYKIYDIKSQSRPAGSDHLPRKVPYYLDHEHEFDILFLGDSRTLCAMHPDKLEPYLGAKSFNLGHWATWFANQYSLFNDVVPHIPEETIVVWSIGHQNFDPMPVKDVYPIGWQRIPFLLDLGYSPSALLSAQLHHEPLTFMMANRTDIYTYTQNILKKNLMHFGRAQPETPSIQSPPPAPPNVGFVEPWYAPDGQLVSVAYYKNNGAYLRQEIVPSYYREKQEKQGSTLFFKAEPASPRSMALFTSMLELFKRHNIKLIVNEIEEAPYRYANKEEQEKYRNFMKNEIQPIVESYGFSYMRVNFDKLKTSDYFDYNHLNQDGVDRYSALLGPKLKALKNHAF